MSAVATLIGCMTDGSQAGQLPTVLGDCLQKLLFLCNSRQKQEQAQQDEVWNHAA
jgi:hypothetical protein